MQTKPKASQQKQHLPTYRFIYYKKTKPNESRVSGVERKVIHQRPRRQEISHLWLRSALLVRPSVHPVHLALFLCKQISK